MNEKIITLSNGKSLVLSYAGLAAYIAGARKKGAIERTLELNTVAVYTNWCGEGDIVIRFYYTDIIIYHADGSFTLNTGGWHTQTTVARLNTYNPAGLCFGVSKRVLYVYDHAIPYGQRGKPVRFYEGMRYVPSESGRYVLEDATATV